MAHEVESMAYANQTPWHGLGNKVDNTLTPEEMGIAAGLNWTVSQHPCYAKVGEDYIETDKVALIRDSDKSVLTITSEFWQPTQNHDALSFFKEFCERGGAKMETAGSLRSGRQVWALANIGSGFTMPNGDRTEGYLLFSLPHELGKSIQVRTTSVRVVCANTLAIAHNSGSKASYKQNHMSVFDFQRAAETVHLAQEAMVQYSVVAQKLLDVKLTERDVMRFLSELIDDDHLTDADFELYEEDVSLVPARIRGIMESYHTAPGATPDSAWGLLNGITHFVDHKGQGRTQDARLTSAWFGTGQALKEKSYNKLLELINV